VRIENDWQVYTLSGMQPIDPHALVVHVSYFEADAFARWAGKRLPTEQEWEHTADGTKIAGSLQESGILHPMPYGAQGEGARDPALAPSQMFGDVWE
jgi:formylglycine-generating enzyme required for sulfatase activity